MIARQLFTPPREVSPASEWSQRWTAGTHSWRHRSEGGFNPARYSVEPVDEATAKSYVLANHYSASYPAASRRWALRTQDRHLVGIAVLGVPMSTAVLTNVFPECEPFVESLELSRLILADAVPGNAESWFIARVFDEAAAAGIRGVVTFADPVPRIVAGHLLFPGHIGTIYKASNAIYTGRATPRTLTLLPDGQVLSARAAQKLRQTERGHDHVEARLVALGARRRQGSTPGAAWLAQALDDVGAVRLRHPGNHRYAFRLGVTRRARAAVEVTPHPLPYPTNADGDATP